MRTCVSAILALVFLCTPLATLAAPEAFQAPARTDCRETSECRQLALDAAARGAYETFHDLIWRAIQTGPPDDPELLYLLARAQSLSNRPHDALVVLRRLADRGVVVDASHDDLRSVRALAGWPALAAVIDRVTSTPRRAAPETASSAPASPQPSPAAAAPSAAAAVPPPTAATSSPGARVNAPAAEPTAAPVAPAPAPEPPAAPVAPAPPRATAEPVAAEAFEVEPLPVEEAVRFSADRFVPGGLAYDAVSRRFLFGDRLGRKLMVVAEGARHTVDMVRAESAGFDDVTAMDIDRTRGDLWVVTTRPDGGGTLHKLQLISGRILSAFEAPAEIQPVRFTDVAVTASGNVLVLDSVGQRLFGVRPRADVLEPITRLEIESPSGLAPTDDERIVYIAHRDGIVLVDTTSRTTRPLDGPSGLELGQFERIRWFRGSLVGVQTVSSGSRRIVRLHLNRAGSAVTRGVVVDPLLGDDAGPSFATISGDDLYYLELRTGTSGGAQDTTPTRDLVDGAVQRIRLR